MKLQRLLPISGRCIVLIASLFMSCAPREKAIAKLTMYEAKQGYREQVRNAISDYVLHSLSVNSNIMSEAYYERDSSSIFWLIERWETRTDLVKSAASAEFRAIEALSKHALAEPSKGFYVNDLEPLSRQQWRRPAKKEDRPLTIMLFVDTRSGTQDIFKEVYHMAMPQFRGEEGVVTYQLSQLEEDSTKFVTYEKFRSDEAFQYHLNFPPVNPVIDFLEKNSEKLPFQSGLHHLVEFAPLFREED
jgi:quinol monooxygenase YgiN